MKLHEEFLVTFHKKAQLWEVACSDLYGRWRHVISIDLMLQENDQDGEVQALRMHRRGGLSTSQLSFVEEYTNEGRFEGSEALAMHEDYEMEMIRQAVL